VIICVVFAIQPLYPWSLAVLFLGYLLYGFFRPVGQEVMRRAHEELPK
jgi:hypothetical protein